MIHCETDQLIHLKNRFKRMSDSSTN